MARFNEPTPNPSPGKAPVSKEQAVENIMNQLKGSGAAAAPGPTAKDPLVFLGWGTAPSMSSAFQKDPGGLGVRPTGWTPGVPGVRPTLTGTVSQVAGQYYSWDAATKNKFLTQVGLAGYDVASMKDGQLAALWGNYVAQASEYYKNGVNVTPWDIMSKDMSAREAAVAKPRTVKQTGTSYDVSTAEDARAIFMTAAQQLLGRDPTKSETRAFQNALNKMEMANPTVTTTTSQYLGSDLQSQESVSKGGVKEGARQVLAMDEAKRDPEYGAYQAATTYFDALMDMIGGMD